VEGAVLLIDAVKGVQAQTLSTLRAAREAKLAVIPVINKIDLKNAQIPQVTQQIKAILNPNEEPLKISAKTGQGVSALLAAIIDKIPAPQSDPQPTTNDQRQPLKALVFDSYYDNFSGIVAIVRVFQGSLKKDQKLRLINTQKEFPAKKVGVFTPNEKTTNLLTAGSIGWVATGIKEPQAVPVGETLGQSNEENPVPLAGFKIPKAKVFADFFPQEPDNFSDFIKKLEQLQLNDPALKIHPIQSKTFGRGAQLGCLGQLHLQIAKERLVEASGFKIISTLPTVAYQGQTQKQAIEPITNPVLLRQKKFQEIREPWIKLTITVPQKYLGPVLKLMETTRAQDMKIRPLGDAPPGLSSSYSSSSTQIIEAEVPLQDTFLTDFYDALKSSTQGYGSADYEFLEYRKTDPVLLEVLLAGETLLNLSRLIPKSKALTAAQKEAIRLKNILPRQVFSLSVQIGITPFKSLPEGKPKIIARQDLPAVKKNVTAGLYGGDFTRKKKLLVKQRQGQKRLAQTGRLSLPREIYAKLLTE
jgi:GTP-binding protein LepA